jgi:hypothetical protein
MKWKMFITLSVLSLALVFGLPKVQAQSRLVANVPFDFCVGQQAMDAGQYEVFSLGEQSGELRNVQTNAAQAFIKAIKLQASNGGHARLVFNKYGNQYFLSEIWDGNSDTGIKLSQSQREKETRLAGNRFSDGPDTVIVAMK